jgi:hypothetical protein
MHKTLSMPGEDKYHSALLTNIINRNLLEDYCRFRQTTDGIMIILNMRTSKMHEQYPIGQADFRYHQHLYMLRFLYSREFMRSELILVLI